jgi:hypothetical protein
MMPGAAYATPHSTERDGHLHSVSAGRPRPKERFDFFRTVAYPQHERRNMAALISWYDDVMGMGRKKESAPR